MEAASDARRILDSVRYMTLATADEGGRPWASPVWFARSGDDEFLWVSRPDARHSLNIASRAEVALVIFDSTVPIGGAEAVYVDATAEEVGPDALGEAVEVFSRRSQDVGAREWTVADVSPPAPHRLYRATASATFVLGPGDRRLPLR